MALDIAAGILIAGIISGVFWLGVWMFGHGLEDDNRGFSVGGALTAVAAFVAALWLIASRTTILSDLAMFAVLALRSLRQ